MKNKFSVIFFWALAGVVLLYMAISIIPSVFSSEGLTVEPARAIIHNDSIFVSGIALRDEIKVEASQPPASVDYKISDGARVSFGDIVAVYSNGTVSSADRLSIEAIDRKISLLSDSISATTQFDLKTLDARTKDSICDYLTVSEGNNLSDTRSASSQVLSYFIKRDIKASGDKNYYRQILENCEASKTVILSGNSAVQTAVKASKAGYFSSAFDGFESFTSEEYSQVTPNDLQTLLSAAPKERPENYIGKLQHFSYWSYLCTVSEEQAELFPLGAVRTLRFDTAEYGPQTVTMTVKYVSPGESGRVVVVFECSFFDEALYSLRICDAEIILKTYSGYRVKKDSLRVSDGVNGVYVLSGAKLVFKPVTILYRSDESDFVVVAPNSDQDSRVLFLNDSVVVGGKEIYDGKVVNIN